MLTETREKLARAGSSTSYDSRCLHLTEEEVARKVKAGEKHIVRFSISGDSFSFLDFMIIFYHPERCYFSTNCDWPYFWSTQRCTRVTDPVLLKTDMFPTYHLASVIDDHEMGITHVFRGEARNPGSRTQLGIFMLRWIFLGTARLSSPPSRHFCFSRTSNTYIRTFSRPTQRRRF